MLKVSQIESLIAKKPSLKVGDKVWCACLECFPSGGGSFKSALVKGVIKELYLNVHGDAEALLFNSGSDIPKSRQNHSVSYQSLRKVRTPKFKVGDLVWCNCKDCFPLRDGTESKAIYRGTLLAFIGGGLADVRQNRKPWSTPRELYLRDLCHCIKRGRRAFAS